MKITLSEKIGTISNIEYQKKNGSLKKRKKRNQIIMNPIYSVIKKNQSFFALSYHLHQKFRYIQNFSKFEKNEQSLLYQIQDKGYAVIPNFVDEGFCNQCINDLEKMLVDHSEYVQKKSDLRIFGAEELSKNIKEYSSNKFLFDLMNHYNKEKTYNAFCLANKIEFSDMSSKLGSGGGWHKDSIQRTFKSILYLNDVDENNGVYQLIEKSHKLAYLLKDMKIANMKFKETRFTDKQIEKILEREPSRLKTLTGKAGTLIVKDCSVIHRGSPLKMGKRYALTNYCFQKRRISSEVIDHFSPIVSPKKVKDLIINDR